MLAAARRAGRTVPLMSALAAALLLLIGVAACTAPRPPPVMPPGPASVLPQVNGAAFPAFRTVFQNGECDGHDEGGPGTGPIDQAKRCYSCFRIPSIVVDPKTKAIHAFAEARRGDNEDPVPAFHGMMTTGPALCVDIPDTRLAYKRSTDGGKTWSPLAILAEALGRCRGQPTPVIDNITDTIWLAFVDGCNPKGIPKGAPGAGPMIMSSTNGGRQWSNATRIRCTGRMTGQNACAAGFIPTHVVPALGRGLVVQRGPSDARLFIPTGAGPMYSDNHGQDWSMGSYYDAGENSITAFDNGTWAGYVMTMRCENERGMAGCAESYASISFSNDLLTWSPRTPIPGLNPWIQGSADQNQVLGVRGGIILTHGGCTPGPTAPACLNATADGGSDGTTSRGERRRLSGGHGMKLLFSKDGFSWRLLQTLWPFAGGYSALASLEVDPDGQVTKYAALFEAGGVFGNEDSDRQALIFNNFSVPAAGY